MINPSSATDFAQQSIKELWSFLSRDADGQPNFFSLFSLDFSDQEPLCIKERTLFFPTALLEHIFKTEKLESIVYTAIEHFEILFKNMVASWIRHLSELNPPLPHQHPYQIIISSPQETLKEIAWSSFYSILGHHQYINSFVLEHLPIEDKNIRAFLYSLLENLIPHSQKGLSPLKSREDIFYSFSIAGLHWAIEAGTRLSKEQQQQLHLQFIQQEKLDEKWMIHAKDLGLLQINDLFLLRNASLMKYYEKIIAIQKSIHHPLTKKELSLFYAESRPELLSELMKTSYSINQESLIIGLSRNTSDPHTAFYITEHLRLKEQTLQNIESLLSKEIAEKLKRKTLFQGQCEFLTWLHGFNRTHSLSLTGSLFFEIPIQKDIIEQAISYFEKINASSQTIIKVFQYLIDMGFKKNPDQELLFEHLFQSQLLSTEKRIEAAYFCLDLLGESLNSPFSSNGKPLLEQLCGRGEEKRTVKDTFPLDIIHQNELDKHLQRNLIHTKPVQKSIKVERF